MKKLKVVAKVTFEAPPENGVNTSEEAEKIVGRLLNDFFGGLSDDRGTITWELTSEEVE
jgi:hypothetical protein